MPLYAQMNSFTLALTIVEDYGNEQIELLANLEQNIKGEEKGRIENAITASKKEKENTISKLKNVRWLESEPDRLTKRVFTTVNAYTNRQIEILNELSARLKSENKKEINSIIERTSSLRDRSLSKLKEAQREERTLEKQIPSKEGPATVIDSSPVENPAKGRGLWER